MQTHKKLAEMMRRKNYKRNVVIEWTGANKSTVSNWLSGKAKPSGKHLVMLCSLFDCPVEWLLSDDAPFLDSGNYAQWLNPLGSPDKEAKAVNEMRAMYEAEQIQNAAFRITKTHGPDTRLSQVVVHQKGVPVPFAAERLLDDNGARFVCLDCPDCGRYSLPMDVISKLGINPQSVRAIEMRGNSMAPVLPNNSLVLVDLDLTEIVDGKLYAFDHGGMLRIKLVYRTPNNGIRLTSYNHAEHPDEFYSCEARNELKMLGQVFWSVSFR